jgi:hypothetical protein
MIDGTPPTGERPSERPPLRPAPVAEEGRPTAHQGPLLGLAVGALGVVFGDIARGCSSRSPTTPPTPPSDFHLPMDRTVVMGSRIEL